MTYQFENLSAITINAATRVTLVPGWSLKEGLFGVVPTIVRRGGVGVQVMDSMPDFFT